MDLLGKLGIDFRLLIAQTVNFLILMAILGRYFYAPIIKAIEEREKSQREIEAAKRRLSDEQAEFNEKISQRRREADEKARALIEDAEKDANEVRRIHVTKALTEADEIVRQAESRAEDRLRAYIMSRRGEIIRLAKDVTARLIRGEHGKEADRTLRRELMDEIRRKDWTKAKQLIRERPPSREQLIRVDEFIAKKFGPHAFNERRLAWVLEAPSVDVLSSRLSSLLKRTVKASSADFEEIKKTASPTVTITSALPLPEQEADALVRTLEEFLDTSLFPMFLVDTSLLGGAALEIAGIRLDGTLSGRLKRLVEARTS